MVQAVVWSMVLRIRLRSRILRKHDLEIGLEEVCWTNDRFLSTSISSQMTQCRIILLLQLIAKLYLFTIELKLRDDFRCFRSQMCFRTFSTALPMNSPIDPTIDIMSLVPTPETPAISNSKFHFRQTWITSGMVGLMDWPIRKYVTQDSRCAGKVWFT